MMHNGEVWLAKLSSNNAKAHPSPVLILQNQILIDVEHPTTIVLPLTMELIDDAEPLRIRISAQHKLKQHADVLVDQICTINHIQLVDGPLAKLNQTMLDKVHAALLEVMGF